MDLYSETANGSLFNGSFERCANGEFTSFKKNFKKESKKKRSDDKLMFHLNCPDDFFTTKMQTCSRVLKCE